jgi:hypothetical protein
VIQFDGWNQEYLSGRFLPSIYLYVQAASISSETTYFLGKESSASPLPKRTQSNVTSSDIVTRNSGMKVIYNMEKYVLNNNAKLNS